MDEMHENEKTKLIQENSHLKKYLSELKVNNEPQFYFKLSRNLKELKNPNIIYTTKGFVFIHIFTNEESEFTNYNAIEPKLNQNLKEKRNKIMELLYRSLDSDLKPGEQKELDNELKNSEELQSYKEELIKMRTSLKQTETQNFGYMFADKVMQKINKLEDNSKDEQFFDSIISVFRPLAIAAAFLLVFLISYNMITENGNLFYDSQEIQDITLAEVFDPFNEFTTE